jgi:CRISPR-associated exonuclease Cas4
MVILFAIAVILIAVVLFLWSSRLQQNSGLPHGRVIYSDTGAWQRNDQSLFSSVHRITGKPDYLVRDNKDIIPVEVKSGNAPVAPRHGHVLQLAAYCLLVEECLGTRPKFGIIKYADREFVVDYTPSLEHKLLCVVGEMREGAMLAEGPHRNHSEIQRCRRCGVRDACTERLTD